MLLKKGGAGFDVEIAELSGVNDRELHENGHCVARNNQADVKAKALADLVRSILAGRANTISAEDESQADEGDENNPNGSDEDSDMAQASEDDDDAKALHLPSTLLSGLGKPAAKAAAQPRPVAQSRNKGCPTAGIQAPATPGKSERRAAISFRSSTPESISGKANSRDASTPRTPDDSSRKSRGRQSLFTDIEGKDPDDVLRPLGMDVLIKSSMNSLRS